MEIIRKEINIKKRSEQVYILPIGDIHLGNKFVDMEKLKKLIQFIKDTPNYYWLGMGDYCECINFSDIRFDPFFIADWCQDHLDDLPKIQAQYFCDLFSPIRHRCLGLLAGNHEDLIRRKYHQDTMGYICTTLSLPCLSTQAIINVVFKRCKQRKLLRIFAMHGYGGTRTETASLGKIIKKGNEFEADIYLMGHDHFKISHIKILITSNLSSEPIGVECKRIFAVTGTFLKIYNKSEKSSYAERMSYPPVISGCLRIIVEPFRRLHIGNKFIELPPHIHISE